MHLTSRGRGAGRSAGRGAGRSAPSRPAQSLGGVAVFGHQATEADPLEKDERRRLNRAFEDEQAKRAYMLQPATGAGAGVGRALILVGELLLELIDGLETGLRDERRARA